MFSPLSLSQQARLDRSSFARVAFLRGTQIGQDGRSASMLGGSDYWPNPTRVTVGPYGFMSFESQPSRSSSDQVVVQDLSPIGTFHNPRRMTKWTLYEIYEIQSENQGEDLKDPMVIIIFPIIPNQSCHSGAIRHRNPWLEADPP